MKKKPVKKPTKRGKPVLVWTETHARLKIQAASKGVTLMEHIDDLSLGKR